MNKNCLAANEPIPIPQSPADRKSGFRATPKRFNLVTVTLLLVAQSPGIVRAQPVGNWVGKRVVQKSEGIQLRIGKSEQAPLAQAQSPKIRMVAEEDEPWLLLEAWGDGPRGWVRSEQVVPARRSNRLLHGPDPRQSARCILAGDAGHGASYDKNELDLALSDYDLAIRLDDTRTASWIGRGRVWYRKKEYAKAIADYNEAIRLNPRDAELFTFRGLAFLGNQRFDQAIHDCGRAIQLDPLNIMGRWIKAGVWLKRKEYDKAIDELSVIISWGRGNAAAFTLRGRAWFEKVVFDKAL